MSSRKKRVYVTGLGAISPYGSTVAELWDGCLSGEDASQPIPAIWTRDYPLKSVRWSPLPPIDYSSQGLTHNECTQYDVGTLIALIVTRDALRDAGYRTHVLDKKDNRFAIDGINEDRWSVHLGTGVGGIESLLGLHSTLILKPRADELAELGAAATKVLQKLQGYEKRINPFTVSMVMPNAAAAAIGIKYGLTGGNNTYTQACAAATMAIGHAYKELRNGDADAAIVGGTEWMHAKDGTVFHAWDRTGTLVRQTDGNPHGVARPFDTGRSGMLFAQGGAGTLILETEEHVTERNGEPIAEIAGYAESFDAYSLMMPRPDGIEIEKAIVRALEDAQCNTNDVKYINSHGTGTVNNDQIEADVLLRIYDDHKPYINSTKGLIGHTLAASGAIEAIITAKTIATNITHACANLDNPIAPLPFVRQTLKSNFDVGVSQSFGFGGNNAALVMRSVCG